MAKRAPTFFLAPQAGGVGLVQLRKANRAGRVPRDEAIGKRPGNSKRERKRLGEL